MKNLRILFIALVCTILAGCNSYLDKKSDIKLAIPSSLQDMEALLGYAGYMNQGYTAIVGEVAGDNLYLAEDSWKAINREEERGMYIWQFIPVLPTYWTSAYNRVLHANIVLDNIDNIADANQSEINRIKGMAFFIRGLSFFDLMQMFSSSYDSESSGNLPGIVLRLSADIDEKLHRSTQLESLLQIEKDLLNSEKHLGDWNSNYSTQPSIAAVYALLSKYYLMLNEFEKSLHYAELSLNQKNDLLDYNKIPVSRYPFERNNEEVLFYYQGSGQAMMQEVRARINPEFYPLYSDSDKRKELFFTVNSDGYHAFTGDYGKGESTNKFCGLTTAEVWLTKAECEIRLGKKVKAIETIDYFLKHRYSVVDELFKDFNNNGLLHFILEERRKELIFRGVRWFDLRRLSPEESGVKEIVRNFDQNKYAISIEELKKFRFALPENVLEATGMQP